MATIGAELEYYADLLQVPYDVTADNIKTAYESMMQNAHPDNGGSDATSKKITDAYTTLLRHLESKEASDAGTSNATVDMASPDGGEQAPINGLLQQDMRAFPCQHCDKAFSRKHNLERHVRCHTGEKPFVCSVCQKAFRQNHDLAAHRRVHTGEKPYNCSQCDKSFARKQKLRLHEAAVHSGERRYKCNDCTAAFVQANQLKLHRKVHSSGDPVFDCAKCGRFFSQKSACLTHSKKCQVVWF